MPAARNRPAPDGVPTRRRGYVSVMDHDHEDSHDDDRREVKGTHADNQPAEFIDTPENQPGDQDQPPKDKTGLGSHRP